MVFKSAYGWICQEWIAQECQDWIYLKMNSILIMPIDLKSKIEIVIDHTKAHISDYDT